MADTDWPPVTAAGEIALSVVVPVFNEVDNVPHLASELLPAVDSPLVEVILVDDGSTDGTVEAAREARGFRVISIPRAGKTEAMRRGIEAARGEWILTLDGDLQEDPAEIRKFWSERDDLDALVGVRSRRCDSMLAKRVPSHAFNVAVRLLFGVELRDINCGFRLIRRSSLSNFDWFRGAHRFLPLMLALRGARVRQRPVVHRARRAGVAKFNSLLRGPEAARGILHLLREPRRPRSEGTPERGYPRSRAALFLALYVYYPFLRSWLPPPLILILAGFIHAWQRRRNLRRRGPLRRQ